LAEENLREWADVLDVLGNPVRLGIILVLYGSEVLGMPTPCLTFTQIKEIMRLPSESALAHHLGRLVDVGLVDKTAAKDEANRVYPEYRIGKRGTELLKKIGLADVLADYIKERLLRQA